MSNSPSGDSETLGEIMSRTVHAIAPTDTVNRAVSVMVDHDIGAVLIVENGRLVGILTERDILKKIVANGEKGIEELKQPVDHIASRPVVTATPSTPIWEAFMTVFRKRIRRLPIVEGDRITGIVTERDLFKWVAKVASEPNIPEDIKKLIAEIH